MANMRWIPILRAMKVGETAPFATESERVGVLQAARKMGLKITTRTGLDGTKNFCMLDRQGVRLVKPVIPKPVICPVEAEIFYNSFNDS